MEHHSKKLLAICLGAPDEGALAELHDPNSSFSQFAKDVQRRVRQQVDLRQIGLEEEEYWDTRLRDCQEKRHNG